VAVAVSAAIIALMVKQLIALPAHPEMHEALREQLDTAAPFLPRNTAEHAWFNAVAVTAGVCEEVLFRGFCLAYVASFSGPWWSVLVTSLIFGLGHLYQGRGGALKTGIVGVITGAMVVGGGTIWLPILLHVFVDIHGGLVYRIVKR
jgi:membrane protease YdiL (CAAX protease family)